ncbi:signal recognition particle receptor subunit alpha [Candidatus Woesearchaeota archaeon]|nr:signal recognition particle receptor subunit alpha [Candidatus Woesearchaeota archaeon]MCF8013854.1 signal recognition particle receptor subunit alpha [Candidatus Woesearchaeota archaeon]
MVLEGLSESLKKTLSKITGSLYVDEKLINELVKDIQRALLQSDVNVQLVLEITKNIKERALKEKTPKTINKREHLINIVYEELVNFLGKGDHKTLIDQIKTKNINKQPYKIMLVGLFGSGKTTTTGKLANYFKKRGIKTAVITTDTWRPAAYDQLEQTAKKINIDFYGNKEEKNPAKIYSQFEKQLQEYDLILIDTAGRDALNNELVEELQLLNKTVNPDESFLVISGDIGQTAQKQATAFHDNANVKGVIITKLDGTSKGGGALAACSVTGAPVRFLGTGEKTDDLEEFKPEGFVGRLLGMGDLEALLEKTKEAFTEEDAEEMQEKLMKGNFSLQDLYDQMKAMKKMGPLNKVLEMIPGLSQANIPKDVLKQQEGKIDKWKFLMDSMTQKEKDDPEIITGKRIERISKGSGQPSSEIRALLKQYRQSKKMMKMMKGGSGSEKDMQKMMQKMQKGGMKGFKF